MKSAPDRPIWLRYNEVTGRRPCLGSLLLLVTELFPYLPLEQQMELSSHIAWEGRMPSGNVKEQLGWAGKMAEV